MTTLTAASTQWATRPADQRFKSRDALREYVDHRTQISSAIDVPFRELRVARVEDDLELAVPGLSHLGFTNYSFEKLAGLTETPAGFLKKLNLSGDLDLVETILNTRLQRGPAWLAKKDVQLYYAENETNYLRSVTSTHYGRVLDADLLRAVDQIDPNGLWTVPPAFNAKNFVVDQQNTTLYASDRDMFLFLVREDRPIEVDGQTYFKGFYAWNSEVGDSTLGISTFLYQYVCCNRMIWGARDVQSLEFKHTDGAPDRFVKEVMPMLTALVDASDQPIVERLTAAKNKRVAETADAAEQWLRDQGFAREAAQKAVLYAGMGGEYGTSGDPTSLLSLVQGGTAYCRTIEHTDARLAAERKFSALIPA